MGWDIFKVDESVSDWGRFLGFCERGTKNVGVHKARVISLLAEELLASQEVFCTLGLLTLSDLWLCHALFGLNVCRKCICTNV
jgi:hypothetical protein